MTQKADVSDSPYASTFVGETINYIINGQSIEIPRQLTPYLPINVADECIGRHDDLERLAAKIKASSKVVLVNGLGGIGKTTLAKAWLQGVMEEYDHLAWIDIAAGDDDKAATGLFETIAYHPTLTANLHLSFDDKEPPWSRFIHIMNALRQLKGKNLLVVDNAGAEFGNKEIREHLPASPNWQVLMTSRSRLHGYEPMPLDRLEPEFAAALFRKFYAVDCPEEVLKALLEEVDYHTLTIELLAKTLQNHFGSLTIDGLLSKLQSRRLSDPGLQRTVTLNHSPEETEVFTHLLITFDAAGLDEDERLLLARFAALPPGRAFEAGELAEWFEIPGEELRIFHETLDRLDRKGWLSQSGENQFSLHRMIRQALLWQLNPGIRELEVLVRHFADKLDFNVSTNFTLLFPWIPFAEQLLLIVKEEDFGNEEVGLLLNNLGVVNRYLGQYEKARDSLEGALASAVKNFGKDHSNVAVSQSNLATVYSDLGQYEKARDLLEEALASDLKNFGNDHPTVAVRQLNLGAVYSATGEKDKARELLKLAYQLFKKQLGEAHPETINARNWLENI